MPTQTPTAGAPPLSTRRQEVLTRIAWIQKASVEELREFWHTLNPRAVTPTSRRTMEQRLIYQVQEQAYGGLDADTRASLDAIADADSRQARDTTTEAPIVGTRYIRIWRGERYEVTAVEGGFEYGGRLYRSLTAVAKAITGQHWNGKLFFGVGKHEKKGEGK